MGLLLGFGSRCLGYYKTEFVEFWSFRWIFLARVSCLKFCWIGGFALFSVCWVLSLVILGVLGFDFGVFCYFGVRIEVFGVDVG